MTPRGETLLYKGGGVIQRDAPDGKGNIVSLVEISPAEVPTLPVKPGALRTRLLDLIDEDYNAPRHELERMIMSAAVDLATELPASPELRAAAYRLLASEPGVRDIGRVTDHESIRGRRPSAFQRTRPGRLPGGGVPCAARCYNPAGGPVNLCRGRRG